MKKFLRTLFMIFLVLCIVYLVGPEPPAPELNLDLPSYPADLDDIESMILKKESAFKLKPDNGSRFLWANDSLKERTEWALLYLHGFSASWYEGHPINSEFAKTYRCNAYFPRLATHGIDTTDALFGMTPDVLWNSAKDALMVAQRMGSKVVIMSTSTGGTLALKLAAEFPEYVDALILYSPNVRINNTAAFLLSKPWGLQIARGVYKSKYRITNEDFGSKECQYWYCKYRVESLVYLQQLVEKTMKPETFERIMCPVFLGYYYKDSGNQDEVVRVDSALKMFGQLGTPTEQKVEKAFPDAGNHVIAGELFSKSLDDVKRATFDFADRILHME